MTITPEMIMMFMQLVGNMNQEKPKSQEANSPAILPQMPQASQMPPMTQFPSYGKNFVQYQQTPAMPILDLSKQTPKEEKKSAGFDLSSIIKLLSMFQGGQGQIQGGQGGVNTGMQTAQGMGSFPTWSPYDSSGRRVK